MKLTGPMLSLDASGSIGGAVTFAKWKGRNYARVLVKPSNPKSEAQVANRSMMKFLSQQWAGLTVPEKASWTERADAGKYSAFNAFVAYNMSLWQSFITPSPTPEPTGGSEPTPGTATATAGVKQITLNWVLGSPSLGAVIFRAEGDFPAGTKNEVIAVIPTGAAGSFAYTDSLVLTGTEYFYKVGAFTGLNTLGSLAELGPATPN